jgi:hypothetical protein
MFIVENENMKKKKLLRKFSFTNNHMATRVVAHESCNG